MFVLEARPELFPNVQPMWVGIAGQPIQGEDAFEVAISIHDSVYNTDYASWKIPFKKGSDSSAVEDHVIEMIKKFSQEHLCKFLGAGVTLSLLKEVSICVRQFASHLTHCPIDSESLHPSLARNRRRPDCTYYKPGRYTCS